jgi:hypothetical protein
MDGQRFDSFTRLLASGGSRRGLLRAVAGLGVGLLVGIGRNGPVAADHCGLLGTTCDPEGRPCCPGFGCDPDTLTCERVCASLTDPCAADGDCCPDLFCIEGACGRPSECTEFLQPCTSSDECCGTQFGTGFCSSQGLCAACSPEDGSCGSTAECCPGLGLQCSFGTCQPCAAQGESCEFNACCAGLSCLEDGTCGVAAPVCVEAGQACDENSTCCDDLPCTRGICGGPDCAAIGQICFDGSECCDDLICDNGACAAPCLGADESCSEDPEGCCSGLICDDGVCVLPTPDGDTATVTIHKATCPTGIGSDIFASCHDNVLAGVDFSINGAGVVTGGNGAAAASVNAGQVTVSEDAGTFAAYLGAYVYCAEQGSGTVLFDGSADSGSVAFTVEEGDDVVCDWYNITAADDDDDDDDDDGTTDGTSGGTSLPQTGIGSSRGKDGEDFPWLGSALVGGAAALLAGKRLRDSAPTPESTD